jgi:hypothetical protein
LRKIGMGSREWMGGKLFRMERVWENVLLGNDLVVGVGYNRRSPAGAGLLVRGEWIVGRGYVRDYRDEYKNCPPT